MFKAFVTICTIAMPNTCQTLEDTIRLINDKPNGLTIVNILYGKDHTCKSPEKFAMTPIFLVKKDCNHTISRL